MTHTDSQVVLKQIYRGELSRRTKYLRLAFEAVKGHLAEGHINLDHIDGKSPIQKKQRPLKQLARTSFIDPLSAAPSESPIVLGLAF